MKSILDVKSVDLFNHRHPFNPQACLCRRYPEEFLIIEEQLLSSKNQNSLKASLTKPLKRSKSDEESDKKNRKPSKLRIEKPLEYPKDNKGITKTFQIKYEKPLSLIAKCLLNSFQKKYLYYAIDDILYGLKSNPIERDNLLAILYSPVLSLHNNLSINFFDIWIYEIYIQEVPKQNKFLVSSSSSLEQFNYLTVKLLYRPTILVKKQEQFW